MARKQNKTQATTVPPEDFLATVEPAHRREDSFALLDFFNRVTGLPARMWGPSIVGYGRYHYKYGTGHQGDFLITGFSPRKTALTVYILPGYRDMADQLARLGKHKIGKSCLYINKLSDVDLAVLEHMVADGLAYIRTRYQTWDE